jgi:polyhydroxyalkanoate synthesis regulator phasin
MTELRITADLIELDGQPVAVIRSDVSATLREALEELLDSVYPQKGEVAHLSDLVERLREQIEDEKNKFARLLDDRNLHARKLGVPPYEED